MKGVALLPEELGGAQEKARAQLPANHVAPLVGELGQVPPGLDVLAHHSAHDRLAGRPDGQALVELAVTAGLGDPGHLGREALDVLGLAHDHVLRDQQREVPVLVARRFDHVVEGALDGLPDREAIGADDHAATDRAVVGQLGLAHHVGVPAVEIDRHARDFLREIGLFFHKRRHSSGSIEISDGNGGEQPRG